MSKYDFGYELVSGTTIDWAYQIIGKDATVLEVGPATGNLAYHLSAQKNCVVDIVELDEDAGKLAARFARNSCLGFVEGNLETEEWFEKLKSNKYDYIVILDVLEHIRNAEGVIQKLRMLLKDTGSILLSIPNIAHNSVILDLLRNRFKYTNVGLLDDTHVHFYTYDTIKKLLNQNNLVTIREQLIQKSVGQNEIAVNYGMNSRDVEAYIKSRNGGTAYQFLFTIQKGEVQPDIRLEYDDSYDKLYEFVCFDAHNSNVIFSEKFNPNKSISVKIEIPKDTTYIRIDPMDRNCVITNMLIVANMENGGGEQYLLPKEFTGILVEDKYAFFDDDPQVYVELPNGVSTVRFECVFECFDTKGLDLLNSYRDVYRQSQYDVNELKKLIEKKDCELAGLYEKIMAVETRIGEQDEQIISLTSQLERTNLQCHNLETELQDIYSTVWGKIYYKLNKSKKA